MVLSLMALWLIYCVTLTTWRLFHAAYVPQLVERISWTGKEQPIIAPWAIDLTISWEANYSFWFIATMLVSAAIMTERNIRRRGYARLLTLLHTARLVYFSGIVLASVSLLYGVSIEMKRLADQPPQMPVSGTPAAGAPGAPPSGAAGR